MTSVLTRNYVIQISITYLNVTLWLLRRVQRDCPLGTKGRVLCPTALIVTKWCGVSLHLSSISSLICSLCSPAPRKISLGQVTFITGSLPRSGRVLSPIISPCLKSNTMTFLIQSRSYTVLFLFKIRWKPGNYGWILFSMMCHVTVHVLVCSPGLNTKTIPVIFHMSTPSLP
jgi:hypothetical protein